MLQRLFWRLFPPFEVKATINEVSSFFARNPSLSEDIIQKEAVALVKDAEKTTHSIRIDGMKPDQLALIVIGNVIGNYISSGEYHIYRGTLGLVGNDMYKVWNTAIRELNEKGYYSDDEAKQDHRWITTQIQRWG